MGKSLQGTQVRNDGEPGLPDRKQGIPGGHTDVAGTQEINTSTDAVAMHCRNDRFPAPFQRIHGLLKFKDGFPEILPEVRTVSLDQGCHFRKVYACGEALPLRPDDDHPGIRIAVEFLKIPGETLEKRIVHGVPFLGPIQNQPGDKPVLFHPKKAVIVFHPVALLCQLIIQPALKRFRDFDRSLCHKDHPVVQKLGRNEGRSRQEKDRLLNEPYKKETCQKRLMAL
jgi:hypothetical protein